MKKPAIAGTLAVAAGLAAIAGRFALSLGRRPAPVPGPVPGRTTTSAQDTATGRLREILSRLSDAHGLDASRTGKADIDDRSDSWTRAVASDVAAWLTWLGAARGKEAPGLDELSDYVKASRDRGMGVATLKRRVSSIATATRLIGAEGHTWSAVVKHSAMRSVSAIGDRTPIVEAMIAQPGEGLRGMRNAAILAIGYAANLKAKEIARVGTGDFFEEGDKVMLTLPATAAKRIGREAAEIDQEALSLLGRWAKAAGIGSGRVFHRIEPVRKGGDANDAVLGDAISGSGTIYAVMALYDGAIARGAIPVDMAERLRPRVRNEPLGDALRDVVAA